MPPTAGLQLICPSVSMLWVRSNVRAPMRAAARAASVPAWPPPMTITSKGWEKRISNIVEAERRVNKGKVDICRRWLILSPE